MRVGVLLFLLVLAIACGSRTDLGGMASGTATPSASQCTKPPWILFDYFGGGGIAAIRVDGSSLHVLDLGRDGAFNPSVSRDSATLLYRTAPGDSTEQSLMLLDLPSGTSRVVVHVSVQPQSNGLGNSAVSPDNTLIAYENSPDVHLINFDGTNDRTLVTGPYNAGCCPWGYGHPAFSGDSRTVFYSTIGRLESIHTDGSGQELLEQDQFFSNPSIPGFVFPNASLSPDATELVAEVACDVSELRIYPIASLPGDACTVGTKLLNVGLSMAPNEASNPAWGPTGLIAYDDGADVFVVDTSGSTPRNLTASLTDAGPNIVAANPVWASGCAAIP
jgi:Tol biopolymer transport system component